MNADAGTIYLANQGRLYFSFVQNDTLFQGETKDRYITSDVAMPIDEAPWPATLPPAVRPS